MQACHSVVNRCYMGVYKEADGSSETSPGR